MRGECQVEQANPPSLPPPRSGVRQRGGEIDESWFLCPFQLPGVAAAAASGGGSLEGDYSPFSFLHILGGFFPPFHMQDHDFTSFPRIGGDFLPFFPHFSFSFKRGRMPPPRWVGGRNSPLFPLFPLSPRTCRERPTLYPTR